MSAPEKMHVPFVDLVVQHAALRTELTDAWTGLLDRADFILGAAVESFEKDFAAFCDAGGAVGVGTGLDALRLTLSALDIRPGDEVLIPVNTFIATALAVTGCGARPVLVDCDSRTYNIDVDQLERSITPKARAILPVHFAGCPADMEAIRAIAGRHDLHVVEDACQSHGARYRGRRCGSLGIAGCFSFYPAKNLGALGDGGIVTSDQPDLLERLRKLRNYGQQAKYEHVVAGTNSRLDTLHAAMLQVKLRHLANWNEARRRHAARYRSLLAGVGDLQFQECPPDSEPVYHLFLIETADRDDLRLHLNERGIQTGIHYPIPIHLQRAYGDLGYRPGEFPVAERVAKRSLSLPMYPELSEQQIDFVAESVRKWFG